MAKVRIRTSLPLPNQAAPTYNRDLAAEPFSVGKTLSPVPREDANIEAEQGETVLMPNKDGLPAQFNISGNRHHSGGTPLNVPKDSFVFSDTKRMRIKDPYILAEFGKSKGSYTPAELAKKYDLNKFRKLLQDPDSDPMQIKTAEKMIENYNLKLAKLALVQESKKGFPQGIPVVAMPFLAKYNINPDEILPAKPEQGLPQMRYGGGIPKAQEGASLQDVLGRIPKFETQQPWERDRIPMDTPYIPPPRQPLPPVLSPTEQYLKEVLPGVASRINKSLRETGTATKYLTGVERAQYEKKMREANKSAGMPYGKLIKEALPYALMFPEIPIGATAAVTYGALKGIPALLRAGTKGAQYAWDAATKTKAAKWIAANPYKASYIASIPARGYGAYLYGQNQKGDVPFVPERAPSDETRVVIPVAGGLPGMSPNSIVVDTAQPATNRIRIKSTPAAKVSPEEIDPSIFETF